MSIDSLCEAFRADAPSSCSSVKEASRRLNRVTATLSRLATSSSDLTQERHETSHDILSALSDTGLIPERWHLAAEVLALQSEEDNPGSSSQEWSSMSLAAKRWATLLHGWLPLLRTLCLTLDELRAADERSVATSAAAAVAARDAGSPKPEGESERAPFDLLSLQALCLAHLGLEIVSAWGLGARLSPHSFGYLRAVGSASRPLSKPVAQLLVANSSGGGSATTAAARAAKVLRLDSEGSDSKEAGHPPEGHPPNGATVITTSSGAASAAWQYERPDKRNLRALVCVVCMERVLRVPQLRPLLLMRYLPDLLTTWMDLFERQTEIEPTSAIAEPVETTRDKSLPSSSSRSNSRGSSSSDDDIGSCVATWAETSMKCALLGHSTAAAVLSSNLAPASGSRADWLQREHFVGAQTRMPSDSSSGGDSSRSSNSSRGDLSKSGSSVACPPVQAPSLVVAVAALRGLATTAAKKKAPPFVQRIVGGHLSHLLCYGKGGLEAVLASYLSPSAGASAAAEDGSVEAVEKLASHLAKLPFAFLPKSSLPTDTSSTSTARIEASSETATAVATVAPAAATSITTTSSSSVSGLSLSEETAAASGTAQYVACLAPQLQSLLDRSLFVYGLGNGHPDDDADAHTSAEDSSASDSKSSTSNQNSSSGAATSSPADFSPPPGTLPGLMAHVSVRLLGRLADTAQASLRPHGDTVPSDGDEADAAKTAAVNATTASSLATYELAHAAVVPLLAPLLLLLPSATGCPLSPFAPAASSGTEGREVPTAIKGNNFTTESLSSSSPTSLPLLSSGSSVIASSGALHKSLVALHAWTALVPPPPSLVRLLAGNNSLDSDGSDLNHVNSSARYHCRSSSSCNAFCSSGLCQCSPLAASLLQYGVLPALLEYLVALRQGPYENVKTTTSGAHTGATQSGITELDSNEVTKDGEVAAPGVNAASEVEAAAAESKTERLRQAARARHGNWSERRALASASALLARLPPHVAAQQLAGAVRLVAAKPLTTAMAVSRTTSVGNESSVEGNVVLQKLTDKEVDACEGIEGPLTEGNYERGSDGAVSDGWVIAAVPPQTSKDEGYAKPSDQESHLEEPPSVLEALKGVRRAVEEKHLNQACDDVLAQLPAEENTSGGATGNPIQATAVWPEVADRATAAAAIAVELAQLADNASGDLGSSSESSENRNDNDDDDTTVTTGLFELALGAAFHQPSKYTSKSVTAAGTDRSGIEKEQDSEAALQADEDKQEQEQQALLVKEEEAALTIQATRFADRALVAAVAGGIDPLPLFGGPHKSGGMSLLRTLTTLVDHLAEAFHHQANAAAELVGGSSMGVENMTAEAFVIAPEGTTTAVESSGNEVALTSVVLGLLGAVVRFGPGPLSSSSSSGTGLGKDSARGAHSMEARREVLLKALVLPLGRLALALSKASAVIPSSDAAVHGADRPRSSSRRKNSAAASISSPDDDATMAPSAAGVEGGREAAVASMLLPTKEEMPGFETAVDGPNEENKDNDDEDDDHEEEDENGRSIALLSESANDLHLDLLRRWTPNNSSSSSCNSNSSSSNSIVSNNSTSKSSSESWDAFVRRRVESNAAGLLNRESPPVRAHAVANITSTLRAAAAHATALVQASAHDDNSEEIVGSAEGLPPNEQKLKGSPLIQEISDGRTEKSSKPSPEAHTTSGVDSNTSTKSTITPLLSDATLGMVVGTLLGMLGDNEAYVYLGAVHALQALFAIPPTAVRTKHFQLLSAIFAQAPLLVDHENKNDDDDHYDNGDNGHELAEKEDQGEGQDFKDVKEIKSKGHQRRRLREVARLTNQAGGLQGHSTIAEAARAALAPLARSTASRLATAAANRPSEAGVAFAAADAAAVVAALEVHDEDDENENAHVRFEENNNCISLAARQRIVPLTSAQQLALCEALVLAVRWSGNAAPHYAPVLLPTLIKGAAPPLPTSLPLQSLPNADPKSRSSGSASIAADQGNGTSDDLRVRAAAAAAAALRASSFSGLAELGSLLGWGVAKHGRSLLDLCLDTLSMERPANDDLFAKVEQTKEPPVASSSEEVNTAANAAAEDSNSGGTSNAAMYGGLPSASHHALAARRGAAFLARELVGSCGRQLLHSENSCPSLHRLWRLLRDVSKGPGVSRARNTAAATGSNLKNAPPTEWSLETDPVVRLHLQQALDFINELMLSELQLQ